MPEVHFLSQHHAPTLLFRKRPLEIRHSRSNIHLFPPELAAKRVIGATDANSPKRAPGRRHARPGEWKPLRANIQSWQSRRLVIIHLGWDRSAVRTQHERNVWIFCDVRGGVIEPVKFADLLKSRFLSKGSRIQKKQCSDKT